MAKGFERKLTSDGTENPKYVDLLEEDRPISGQKFTCVSFVSPEKLLKQKTHFFFEEFLKHFDFTKSVDKFTQFLNFISYKHHLDFDKIMEDYKDFMKSEKGKLNIDSISDDYKTFLDAKEETLEKTFNIAHRFQTATRGLKIRGSYSTQEEAELRAKMLREVDPNHNVYVGPVGMWMPWEPEAYKTGRVEYLEEELNQLMKEKDNNDRRAKDEFARRVKDTKKRAIEENKKLAKETGNKLTQSITKDGELVGIEGMNTIETSLGEQGENISAADIRKELFAGENIRVKGGETAVDEFNNRDKKWGAATAIQKAFRKKKSKDAAQN
jgi:hypothetical protein